jgi:hypothetical protein
MSVLDAEILEGYVFGSLSVDFNHVNGWTSKSYTLGVDKRQINSKDNFVGCHEQVMEWLDARSGNIPT